MSDSFFLGKTTLDPARMIEIGGAAALERHEALRGFLVSKVGRDAADLFAEPLLSRGNGAAPTTISWYASGGGSVSKLADLPPDARGEAEARLRRTLSEVADKLSDPDFGPLLGAALMLNGPDDVWVVDRKPVLINWGAAPPEAVESLGARDRHFAETLGRYLPLAAAPALSREEWAARGYQAAAAPAPAEPAEKPGAGAAAGVAAGAAAAGVGAAALSGGSARAAETGGGATSVAADGSGGAGAPPPGGPGGVAVVEEPEGRRWRWRWIAPVALFVLFGALLVWLLLPGALLYPPRPVQAGIDEAQVAEAARRANESLEERIAQLRGALDGAVCTPQGDLVLPGGATPDGRTPLPRDAAEAPPADAPTPTRPDALTPPRPERLVQPDPAGGDPVTLLATLESGAAMVLANAGDRSGHGTGFFIGPDLLVTNHHVVAEALNGGQVFVTSETLGEVRPAEVLATLGPLETDGGDFALLRVPGAAGRPMTVRISSDPLKLQQVIAAGYPGFALETDQNYIALMQGDAGAAPGLIVTDGIVNAEHALGPGTNTVLHTAHISPGNSGGPLVDQCGRIVGVNTFIRNDEASLNALNFALASADLMAFLAANGATAETTEAPCSPAVAAAPPPVAAAPGAARQ